MAINLPERRLSSAPAPKKRQVPTELILQVMGRNPLAEAITSGSDVLAQALAKRFEKEKLMKQSASQIGAIAKATGTDLTGISDPAIASSIAKSIADNRSEEMRAKESADIRRESAANSMEMRRAMAELMAQNQRASREQRSQQFADKQVNSYSANLEKSGIPNAIAVGERVLSLLPERGQDVPGYGQTGMNPSFLLSRAGKDMRQAINQLFNIELRNRSGAAVTDPELMRLREEFGQGKFATDEALITGVNQYINRLKEISRNVNAGFDSGVREEYVTRGGRDIGSAFDSMATNPRILPLKSSAVPGGGETPEQRKARLLMELRRAR